MTPCAHRVGTSGPSQSPVAGGVRGGRRHAGSRWAQVMSPGAGLHQTPCETPRSSPRDSPRSVRRRGFVTVLCHILPHCNVTLTPRPLPLPPPVTLSSLHSGIPHPELPSPSLSPRLPWKIFLSPGAANSLRAPYISLWTAADSPSPAPSETDASHSEPRFPSYQRAESKRSVTLRALRAASRHGPDPRGPEFPPRPAPRPWEDRSTSTTAYPREEAQGPRDPQTMRGSPSLRAVRLGSISDP